MYVWFSVPIISLLKQVVTWFLEMPPLFTCTGWKSSKCKRPRFDPNEPLLSDLLEKSCFVNINQPPFLSDRPAHRAGEFLKTRFIWFVVFTLKIKSKIKDKDRRQKAHRHKADIGEKIYLFQITIDINNIRQSVLVDQRSMTAHLRILTPDPNSQLGWALRLDVRSTINPLKVRMVIWKHCSCLKL